MTNPIFLWAGQDWPMTDDEHEFLVPAFSRIGRHIHGEKWRDDFPTLNPLSVKAVRVEEAEIEERAWAHRLLSALFPESYVEDYVEPPAPTQNFRPLAALGGGPLPQAGMAIAALSQIDSETARTRSPGWWFSQQDWERFRAAVHYQNEMQKPKIAMVEEAARWLFNRIVRGEIVPFVQHARDGGGWSPTSADDWRMPNPERLRLRIQRCTMVPGRPAVPAGTHWIIINKAELSAAIEKERNGGNLSAPPVESAALRESLLADNSAAPSHGGSDPDEVMDKQAYWRKHKLEIMQEAKAYVSERGDQATKKALAASLKDKWSELSDNWIYTKVWRDLAREKPELSTPGNRRGPRRL